MMISTFAQATFKHLGILPLMAVIVGLMPVTAISQSPTSPDPLVTAFDRDLQSAGIIRNISDPASLSQILKWSKKEGKLTHCTYWLEYQRSQFPEFLPLNMALADCCFLSNDWERLLQSISDDFWSYQEHLRLNYIAFAQRALGDENWRPTWESAIAATSGNSEKTKSLIQFLAQWKTWDQELEDLLWQQVDGSSPLKAMALNSLVTLYEMQNNAKGLLSVNENLLALDPMNPELLNNQISIHVLTHQADSITATHLERFMTISDRAEKYKLTRALYYFETGNPSEVRQYLQSIDQTSLSTSDIRDYVYFLIFQSGIEPSGESLPTKEAYQKLISEGDYLDFERAYLETAI